MATYTLTPQQLKGAGIYNSFEIPAGGGTPSFSNVNSFLFDGVDEKMFSTANYTEINGTQNLSVSFWLKPIDSNDGLVFRFGTQGSTNRLACIYYPSLEIVIISFNTSSYYYRSVNGSIPLNQWSHIVYTYDGTQSRYNRPEIYVNGVLSQGTNTGITLASSPFDGTLELGGTGTSGQQNFGNNYIDEFAVWNSTTLTQTQANELYNGGAPSDLNNITSGLTSPTTWFRMGEQATWNGLTWTMTDVNGGTTLRGSNMQESSRTTDVPPNPFVNTKSILLDGVDDYVSLASRTQNFTDFSVSVWFKTVSKGGANAIIGNSGAEGGYLFFIGQSSGVIKFFDNAYRTISGVITDNAWHHLAVTYDSSANELKSYIDNSLFITYTPNASALGTNSHSFNQIGQRITIGQWIGGLDEIAIFSSVLSASDVSTIYGSSSPTNIASLNPVHWWRCGDGDTAPTLTDNGSGGNNGTMTNFSTFSTDVPFNYKSIQLDGVDDYVDCGTGLGNSQGTITNFSVSMWIKPSVTSGNDLFFNIGDFSNSFGEIAFQLLSNYLFIKIDNTAYRVWIPYTNTSAWEHLAFVYDGSNSANTKMYINGVLQSPSTGGVYPSSLNLSGLKTIIGAGYSVSYPYSGLQDEVSYFNTTLSQSDITSIYNGGVPNDISSLNPLSWWRCGDGDTAPTLTDNGSASNDGTMTNFTTFSTDVPT